MREFLTKLWECDPNGGPGLTNVMIPKNWEPEGISGVQWQHGRIRERGVKHQNPAQVDKWDSNLETWSKKRWYSLLISFREIRCCRDKSRSSIICGTMAIISRPTQATKLLRISTSSSRGNLESREGRWQCVNSNARWKYDWRPIVRSRQQIVDNINEIRWSSVYRR